MRYYHVFWDRSSPADCKFEIENSNLGYFWHFQDTVRSAVPAVTHLEPGLLTMTRPSVYLTNQFENQVRYTKIVLRECYNPFLFPLFARPMIKMAFIFTQVNYYNASKYPKIISLS